MKIWSTDFKFHESLDVSTREQLLVIADHVSVVIRGAKLVKENIKPAVEAKRVRLGAAAWGWRAPGAVFKSHFTIFNAQVMFEQQKELLLMQI